jgi:hypothetical protein
MRRKRLLLRAAVAALALVCPVVGPVCPRDAPASVSIAVTWESLIRQSTGAAVVTPQSGLSVWEGGRIYTYTQVHVEQSVAGDAPSGDAWVRTMGGVVGKVGQLVDGEAVLAPGQRSLLFLKSGPVGAFDVTTRGQGQFLVKADGPSAPAYLARSRSVGMLLPPRPTGAVAPGALAADIIDGRAVDDVARDVAAAWGALHAR